MKIDSCSTCASTFYLSCQMSQSHTQLVLGGESHLLRRLKNLSFTCDGRFNNDTVDDDDDCFKNANIIKQPFLALKTSVYNGDHKN